jgi:hypothetical protein
MEDEDIIEKDKPTKFHKSLGNVKDEEISDGEILLLRALIRDTEQQIIIYRLKEERIVEKIKKLWNSIKEQKKLAQESREFIDRSPLFASICIASGISPEKGRKKFYDRVTDTIERKIKRRKERHGEIEDESESTEDGEG